jgi:hypothetical protein
MTMTRVFLGRDGISIEISKQACKKARATRGYQLSPNKKAPWEIQGAWMIDKDFF